MTVLLPLPGFAVVMYVTPGPNISMVASAAVSDDLAATMPHMLGIVFGFAARLVQVSAGAGAMVLAWPGVPPAICWLGAGWMVWIARRIAGAPLLHESGRRRLLGF